MELALPITVYWDLPEMAHHDGSLLGICDEILACRPLMLQLNVSDPQLSEGVRAILEHFRGTAVAVSLTAPASCLAPSTETPGADLGVKELLVACDSLASLRAISILPEVGLSFCVTRNNWYELAEIVAFCRDRGIKRLVLPMQRLYNGEEPFLLRKREQEILEKSLAAVGGTTGIHLTIHDPFLWRAFNPEIPFPQAGCQAANTMIAISPDGGVYPCPTLPHRLGELGSSPLKTIVTSAAKKELRRSIVQSPAACSDCREVVICKGGCRGRSLVIHGSFAAIDDACR